MKGLSNLLISIVCWFIVSTALMMAVFLVGSLTTLLPPLSLLKCIGLGIVVSLTGVCFNLGVMVSNHNTKEEVRKLRSDMNSIHEHTSFWE